MSVKRSNRRAFLKTSIAGVAAGSFLNCQSQSEVPLVSPSDIGSIPQRPFGRTGEMVSLLGLGGFHIAVPKREEDGISIIREAIDLGVTFLDNAWEYHGGRAEEIMGKALGEGYRDRAFLMTKHHGRDKQVALQHLEDSLRRLRTEVIDLWQFHEIIYEEDPEMIFAAGGGIEAAEQAKKDGKVRFVGFTGHKDPRFLKKMLEFDFAWDAVQMPLSVLDAQYDRSFEKEILPICQERGIAVLAMKALGGGFLQRANALTPREAHQYVLNLPIATMISGMEDIKYLHYNAQTAADLPKLSPEQKSSLLAKAERAAASGQFEPFKTTTMFDSSAGRRLHGLI